MTKKEMTEKLGNAIALDYIDLENLKNEYPNDINSQEIVIEHIRGMKRAASILGIDTDKLDRQIWNQVHVIKTTEENAS